MKDKYNIRNAYSLYRKNCKAEKISPLEYNDYKNEYTNIIDIFYELLFDGKAVILPYIGTFQIIGKTISPKVDDKGNILNLPVDWKSTIRLWKENSEAKKAKKLIYYFNDHTNGVQYIFNWSKKRCIIPNKTVYNFTAMRKRKRKLGEIIMGGNLDFIIFN